MYFLHDNECSVQPKDVISLWTVGVTILLSLTIFLNAVTALIPITSASPLIGKY